MRNLVLLLALAACVTPVPVRFGAHQAHAPVIGISNPSFEQGDPLAGRRAFIDAQCIDCHRVAEDPDLPMGRRAIVGPVLAHLDSYLPNDLAKKITSRSTGANQELFDRTMKDYTQPITAKQLVDIVAYLRNPTAPHRG